MLGSRKDKDMKDTTKAMIALNVSLAALVGAVAYFTFPETAASKMWCTGSGICMTEQPDTYHVEPFEMKVRNVSDDVAYCWFSPPSKLGVIRVTPETTVAVTVNCGGLYMECETPRSKVIHYREFFVSCPAESN